jgi:phage terminase large subunit-like protein
MDSSLAENLTSKELLTHFLKFDFKQMEHVNYRYVFAKKPEILQNIQEFKTDLEEPFRIINTDDATWVLFKTTFTNHQSVVTRMLSRLDMNCDIDTFMQQVSRLSADRWYAGNMAQLIKDLPENYWQQ